MNQTDGFLIKKINGISYLLPVGQRIAEQRRGMRLNETGEQIWNFIPSAKDRNELLALLADYYEIPPEDKDMLKKDMDSFLDQLAAWGMLEEPPLAPSGSGIDMMIGGLTLHLSSPKELIPSEFLPFYTKESQSPDMTIEILPSTGLSTSPAGGLLRIQAEDLLVCEQEQEYRILFPQSPQLQECMMRKDGTLARFYVVPPYREPLLSDLFHAIRLVFLYMAARHGRLAIHSASLYYREQAWLFAGPSGTGKSTHTNLWNQYFHTPVLNGDLNLISCEKGTPMIHGIPWCGTSGISDTASHPLGGIILLRQSPTNLCQEPAVDEQTLLVLQRSISPAWTEDMLEKNLHIAAAVTNSCYITRLFCNREREAAEYMKARIDDHLRQLGGAAESVISV